MSQAHVGLNYCWVWMFLMMFNVEIRGIYTQLSMQPLMNFTVTFLD